MDSVGRRLKEERLLQGWSQRDLARESGVTADTISSVENEGHRPRPSTLRKLAAALGIEVKDFYQEPAFPKADAPRWAGQRSRSLDWALSVSPEEFKNEIAGKESVVELKALGRGLRDARGTLDEHDWAMARDLYAKRRALSEKLKELEPPLAEIELRRGEKPRVVFNREPTPEERAELEAKLSKWEAELVELTERMGEYEAVVPIALS